MVEKINKWITKYKNIFIETFFISLLAFLVIRGIKASWEDFKDYAYKSKLQEQADTLSTIEKEIPKK